MSTFNAAARPKHGQIAIMGGSAEARHLAQRLTDTARLWLGEKDRVSGWGPSQETDFTRWARDAAGLVIAPHPCDLASFEFGQRTAALLEIPYLSFQRPAWRPARSDSWINLRTVRDAANAIPKGATILIALGRPALADLKALRHAHCLVRQLMRHRDPFPLRHGRYLFDEPPFGVPFEIKFLRRHRIDAILTQNAGGTGSWPKIAAAQELGLPVYMVARQTPRGALVRNVNAAINWSSKVKWSDD